MTTMSTRPILLLVRHPLTGSDLQRLWEEAYYKAFRNHFDLFVTEEDCDLDALCDQARPDLIVFRGAYSALHRRIAVKNPLSHASIPRDRKSTRLNSSHMSISYAVFCLTKKKKLHITRSYLNKYELIGMKLYRFVIS